MNYPIETPCLEPQPIAVVRRQATLDQLKTVVPDACGVSWNLVKKLGLKGGRNIAVYLDCNIQGQINMEVGQEVDVSFASMGELFCSATPAGEVVTTAHWGAYSQLPDAHRALRQWVASHQRSLAGPNWELYGHWTDDVTQLRTDVFYPLD
jgi:effector-binding domain-containing protein